MTTGYRMIARTHGGPEVIERENFEVPSPSSGELLIETEAVGLNFIDTYYRKGLYADPLPIQLGSESVGRIAALGDGVTGFAIGDRVGTTHAGGAYATHRLIDAANAMRIPEGIAPDIAAAVMLKGLTACYLAEDTFPAEKGHIALVHSAAGGVGSLRHRHSPFRLGRESRRRRCGALAPLRLRRPGRRRQGDHARGDVPCRL